MNDKLKPKWRDTMLGFEVDLADMKEWSPTVAQVRDAALRYAVAGPSPMEGVDDEVQRKMARFLPRPADIETAADMAHEAVTAGRLIDFGFWPNAMIQDAANRGGPLYTRGALTLPFSEPFIFMHTWDGHSRSGRHPTSIYLVSPLEPDKLTGGDLEATDLAPVTLAGTQRVLTLGDRVLLEPDRDNEPMWSRYQCRVMPAAWRYVPELVAMNNGGTPESAAAGNVLDPVMCALMLLNTNGVVRRTVRPPDKLVRARAKSGKPPIPPHDEVLSAPYVTALLARGKPRSGESQGGTHASPVPHIRRGHPRVYADGRRTFVRDALVNFSADAKEAFVATRSHYEVRNGAREP